MTETEPIRYITDVVTLTPDGNVLPGCTSGSGL